MSKLRAAVIGVNGMGGQHHAPGFQSHPDAEVVALCDVDEKYLEKLGKDLGVAALYTDVGKMFANEQLDLVSIATPNKFHMELTLAALEAGCHVLCEKPPAMNAGEARRTVTLAEERGLRLMINFSFRFWEQSWALKRQVDAGILGDIYFARTLWLRRRGAPAGDRWFTKKSLSGGGPLVDLGVHRLDLALWFMGFPKPVWVLGNTYNPIISASARKHQFECDVEDLAVAMVRFENGAMLELEASWATNIAQRELMETRLLGTKAGLVQRNIGEGYEFEAEIYLEKDGAQYDMKLHSPVHGAPASAYYYFIDCIVKDVPHTATGAEGLAVMEILDAVYLSAETGEPVKMS
ncbi:MAG: Gfo/Idh/MocA family oxidoreductase [Phycisphaerae bacterium]|nr:Gfo/Idh/MocA family oxidoreductase [Phycisphaerae bacterium]